MKYRFLRGIMRTLCAVILGHNLHVQGRSNVPLNGGLLIVGNHFGAIDPPLAGAVIDREDVFFMAKAESFNSPFANWIFRGYHAFPVIRGSADRAALKHSLQLLKTGNAVVLYPEGTRGPHLREPYGGAGFLALRAGVPILPIAVWGTEQVLPKGSKLPRRVPVHVRIGRPFELPKTDGRSLSHRDAADFMMNRIAELLPESYRGAYAQTVTAAV